MPCLWENYKMKNKKQIDINVMPFVVFQDSIKRIITLTIMLLLSLFINPLTVLICFLISNIVMCIVDFFIIKKEFGKLRGII